MAPRPSLFCARFSEISLFFPGRQSSAAGDGFACDCLHHHLSLAFGKAKPGKRSGREPDRVRNPTRGFELNSRGVEEPSRFPRGRPVAWVRRHFDRECTGPPQRPVAPSAWREVAPGLPRGEWRPVSRHPRPWLRTASTGTPRSKPRKPLISFTSSTGRRILPGRRRVSHAAP